MDSVIELIRLLIDCFFSYSIALILAIYTLSLVNIKFAIATFIWVNIFILISVFSFRVLTGLADDHSKQSSQVIAGIADSILNVISVRLFSRQAHERHKFFKYARKLLQKENYNGHTFGFGLYMAIHLIYSKQ